MFEKVLFIVSHAYGPGRIKHCKAFQGPCIQGAGRGIGTEKRSFKGKYPDEGPQRAWSFLSTEFYYAALLETNSSETLQKLL